jgi:hypothetical protein
VLGGGFTVVVTDGSDGGSDLDNVAEITFISSFPVDDDSWLVSAAEDNTGDMDDNWTLTAWAVCALANP